MAALALTGCRSGTSAPAERPLAVSAPTGRLQEVAPPAAVQQLQAALAERSPQLRITAPRDGQTLPAGDWHLRLEVSDWPLVDAGSLGLGTHVVVQIDDQPPLRLTEETSLQPEASPLAADPGGQHDRDQRSHSLDVVLPALAPGSHRLTAYAATPWGEAMKNPGAWQQLRLQRLLANELAVPAAGSPQLIPVSPATPQAAEPVLLDWLLLDAPLQHLAEGDDSWRLRVSLNSDSFLVDQNAPLWLRGWRPGSNALRLDLVDSRGEPLNPPFNSLVREVVLGGTASPRWQGGPLSDAELAALLGDAPPPSSDAFAPPGSAAPQEPALSAPQDSPSAAGQNEDDQASSGDSARAEAGDSQGGSPEETPTAVVESLQARPTASTSAEANTGETSTGEVTAGEATATDASGLPEASSDGTKAEEAVAAGVSTDGEPGP